MLQNILYWRLIKKYKKPRFYETFGKHFMEYFMSFSLYIHKESRKWSALIKFLGIHFQEQDINRCFIHRCFFFPSDMKMFLYIYIYIYICVCSFLSFTHTHTHTHTHIYIYLITVQLLYNSCIFDTVVPIFTFYQVTTHFCQYLSLLIRHNA